MLERTPFEPAGLRFLKMHGAGNDFVVIDARGRADPVTPGLARALGDRHRGVGFDQLAVIGDAADADIRLEFWNADGSTAGACGNATRCVAAWLMPPDGRMTIRTGHGRLAARTEGGRIVVDMGAARLGWTEVPLAEAADTATLPIEGTPAACSMGNPHCTFFVADLDAVDLDALGPRIERHPLFPERTNVQIAQPLGRDRVRALVWERGVGRTLASGSSACAIVVAGVRRGLLARAAAVELPGGTLEARWREDGHVELTGPVATVFEGRLSAEFLAGVGA